ncbi:MAG: hypothetical protein LBG21_03175 [Campylobacteraceae bacterium]|jgi:hypothetical protein|nr:hypothetical protein [Campylobacteraceae bacterium]
MTVLTAKVRVLSSIKLKIFSILIGFFLISCNNVSAGENSANNNSQGSKRKTSEMISYANFVKNYYEEFDFSLITFSSVAKCYQFKSEAAAVAYINHLKTNKGFKDYSLDEYKKKYFKNSVHLNTKNYPFVEAMISTSDNRTVVANIQQLSKNVLTEDDFIATFGTDSTVITGILLHIIYADFKTSAINTPLTYINNYQKKLLGKNFKETYSDNWKHNIFEKRGKIGSKNVIYEFIYKNGTATWQVYFKE